MKRNSIKIFENQIVDQDIKELVPTWKILNKDQRTLYHQFGNTVHSIKKDIAWEAEDITLRFQVSKLPLYEPEYLWVSKDPLNQIESNIVIDPKFKRISNFEYFFTNSFNGLTYHNEQTINYTNDLIYILKNKNEDTITAIDIDGHILSINIKTGDILSIFNPEYKQTGLQTLEVNNKNYAFIPNYAIIQSVIDHNGIAIPYTIQEMSNTRFYDSNFDLDKNGIIDQEDVNKFIAAENIDHRYVSEDLWNDYYSVLDINKDGKIDSYEIELAKSLLNTSSQNGILVNFKRVAPLQKITYYSYSNPIAKYLYKSNDKIYPGFTRTLGSSILEKAIENNTGYNGLIIANNIYVEIDKNNNLVFFRYSGQVLLRHNMAYYGNDKYKAKIMNVLDDTLFMVAVSKTGQYRLYICDLRNEAIEYISEYYDIPITEEILSIDFNADQNLIEFFVKGNNIKKISYKLDKFYYHIDPGTNELYCSKDILIQFKTNIEGIDTFEAEESYDTIELIPRSVQNSVDDFGYNWGLYRIPGESNLHFRERLIDYWKQIQGSTKIGMLNGIGKELGIEKEDIYKLYPSNDPTIKLDSIYKYNLPIRLLIIDEPNKTLNLFSFANYEWKAGAITLYNMLIPSGYTIETPDKYINYHKNYTEFSYDRKTIGITIDDNIHTYDMGGEIIDSTNTIYAKGNILDFTNCNYLLDNFSNMPVIVYYDTMDITGTTHYNITTETKIPLKQSLTPRLQIETLIEPSSYRDKYITNIPNREKLIEDLKNKDNSNWSNTINSISFYNSRNKTGEILKRTIWSGLSFNKHYPNIRNWDY